MRLLLHVLSDDLRTLLLSHWLDVRSLAMLDVAISSKSSRPYWMTLLGSLRSTSIDEMDHEANVWREPVCDLSLLNKSELVYLGLNGCSSVTDECILQAVKRRFENYSNDLNGDNKLTDAVPSAMDDVSEELESINLASCSVVTDTAGVSALGCGCGQKYQS